MHGLGVVVLGVLALVPLTGGGLLAKPAPPKPRPSAVVFLNSVGIDLHLAYGNTTYSRRQAVLDLLRELDVRHVHDAVPLESDGLVKGLRAIARRRIGVTLVTRLKFGPQSVISAARRVVGARLDGLEGPNELDLSRQQDWRPHLVSYLRRLHKAMAKDRLRVPLVGPSFFDESYYGRIPNLRYDAASLHPYPGGLPPEDPLAQQVGRMRGFASGRPQWVTETGYHNALGALSGQPPVSERAAATYLPRLLLAAFANGVRRTIIYELLDEKPDPAGLDPEQHFGLVRANLSPKPAFFAIRNLLSAVRSSPGSAPTPAPIPSISSATPFDRVVLTRGDRSRAIAIWRPVSVWNQKLRMPVNPGAVPATLVWSRPVRDVTVFRPTQSDQPTMRMASAVTLGLSLEGDVVLVSYH